MVVPYLIGHCGRHAIPPWLLRAFKSLFVNKSAWRSLLTKLTQPSSSLRTQQRAAAGEWHVNVILIARGDTAPHPPTNPTTHMHPTTNESPVTREVREPRRPARSPMGRVASCVRPSPWLWLAPWAPSHTTAAPPDPERRPDIRYVIRLNSIIRSSIDCIMDPTFCCLLF